MRFTKFEDIIAWQKATMLVEKIYNTFQNTKDYSFTDQLKRASYSISSNIAEGYERKSNAEFKHFLYIAKGSCGEVRSMMHISQRLGYITHSEFEYFEQTCLEIAKMLSGLIKNL